MSATPPPTPTGESLPPGYLSRNGSTSNAELQKAWRLVVLGYIMAVAIPPGGLMLGIVLARRDSRPHARHGLVIIAVSIVATLVWFLLFNSGIADTSSNDLQ
jgi:hypothetical protein